jgi:signal transduction histidine kinase
LRGRLLLSVLGALSAVLAALTVGFNLVLDHRLNNDANGVAQARASAELGTLRISQDHIVLPESPDELSPDIQVWVFQGSRALERPATSPANTAAAVALARRAPAVHDVPVTQTRLNAMPVVQAGARIGAVVAGVSLVPYQQTQRTALVGSVVLALVVLLVVGVAAWWLIGRALRPVASMTRQAAAWSEHDLDRRFGLGAPHDELTHLAATLDDLLERLATSLRHEQRLSAEISHELRTPLTRIMAEAQYGLRHGQQTDEGRATLEHILQSARQLSRTLDTLMAAARAQLDPQRATSDAVACAQAAMESWVGHGGAQDLDVSVTAPEPAIRVAAEPDLVERVLAPLLENAARHARHWVRMSVTREGDVVCFTIQDDGPGVPDDEREAIFKPGHRVTAPDAATAVVSPSAGLGLALCRRLARSAGGDVAAEASDHGACFVVSLPAAT